MFLGSRVHYPVFRFFTVCRARPAASTLSLLSSLMKSVVYGVNSVKLTKYANSNIIVYWCKRNQLVRDFPILAETPCTVVGECLANVCKQSLSKHDHPA